MADTETIRVQRSEELPPLLTTVELAELLRLSPAAVTTARHRGQAPMSFGFKVGRKLVYRRADVLDWIEEQANRR
jgi:hypothetical protein